MRSFCAACGVVLIASADAKNVTLREVYGAVSSPTRQLPWSQRSVNRAARPSSYFASRVPENCIFPLEVVIVQDATASFQDDFDRMISDQLDAMVSSLQVDHPDSKFGIVTHRDKPIWSLGEPKTDYCVAFESPLGPGVDDLKKVYARIVSTGGGDPSESQFTAAIAALQSDSMGWGAMPTSDVTRIVVIATDAPPHFQGDGLNAYGMTPFSGVWDEHHAAAQCLAEYYPAPQQFKDALKAREAYAAMLVFDGSWWSELPRDSWRWVNSFLEQDAAFFEPLAEDSSNFWEVLAAVIRKIEEIECVEVSTEAPATPAATTTTTVTPTPLATTTDSRGPLTPTTSVATPTDTTTLHPTVTPVGTPEVSAPSDSSVDVECPPCPPCEDHCHDECHEHDHCCHHCHHHCDCPCPQVEIRLRHRPQHLQLNVDN